MQPNSGFEYLQVTAAGSAVVKDRSSRLQAVVCNSDFTGTVIFYDNATGTSSTQIATVANPGGAVTLNYAAQTREGIYYLATGTPAITVITD